MTSARPGPARRLAGALLLALLVLPGIGLPSALPAGAAPPCEDLTLPEETKQARAVLTGTVESVVREQTGVGRDVAFVHTVSVDRVYKPSGSLIQTEQVDVTTRRMTGECSLGPLDEGGRYVFLLGIDDGDLVATGEGGTAPATTARVADVEELLGRGRPPVPPAPVEATLTPLAVSEPVPFRRAAMPGAVLALVGLLGLVVVRRFSGRP